LEDNAVVRRWLQSADVEITDNGEQVVACRAASAATTTTVGVTNVAGGVAVLAANPNRIFAVLQNDSDTDLYITLGPTAVPNQGLRLAANGGAYEIGAGNLYTGPVTGSYSGTTTKNLMATEG
jgi:hypothetical protein